MCLVSCPVLSFQGRTLDSSLCMTKAYWLFSFFLIFFYFPAGGGWEGGVCRVGLRV